MSKGEQAARDLASFVNGASGSDRDDFVNTLCSRTHRTLQQLIFSLFLSCVQVWATKVKEGLFDLRNQATCEVSKKIVDAIPYEDQHIPFI